MSNPRYAAIDIGTNTLLLLVGEREPSGKIRFLRDEHSIARLGEGVDASRRISSAGINRATEILQRYRSICDEFSVQNVVAVGTSALRDAENRADVCATFFDILGVPIRIISGEEEARLTYVGSAERELCTIVDIGGGSTELMSGAEGIIHSRVSMDIGAVRLTERFFSELPPKNEEIFAARKAVREFLSQHNSTTVGEVIGVAGTPTSLGAIALGLQDFSAEHIDGFILSVEKITEIFTWLSTSSKEEILRNPAVHPKRADILPAGTLILLEILHFCRAQSIRVSTRGLRYGVLLDSIEKSKQERK